MKKTLLAMAAILTFGYAHAQMKLGNNPTTTNPNALLEMETTNKGLLLPRVALTSSTSPAPLSAHIAGMVVYNTATAGDVEPGYYFGNGTGWVRVADANAAVSNIYTDDGTLTGARTVSMGANNLSFMGTGMVGISTASPSVRFHVTEVVGGAVARIEHAGGGGNLGDALQAGINNCGAPCGQGTGRNLVMFNANVTNTNFASLDFVADINPSSVSGASIQGIDRDITNNYAGLSFYTRNATDYAPRITVKSSGNVGIGTAAPNASAALDITATNKGFLPPRVALTGTNVAAPLTVMVQGMTVYNTATAGTGINQVVPGLYICDGTTWVKSSTEKSAPKAIVLGNFTVASYPAGAVNVVSSTETLDESAVYNPATSTFTAPRTGLYSFSGVLTTALSSFSAGATWELSIEVNGATNTVWINSTMVASSTSSYMSTNGTAVVLLQAGNVVQWKTYNGTSSSKTTHTALFNKFSITEL